MKSTWRGAVESGEGVMVWTRWAAVLALAMLPAFGARPGSAMADDNANDPAAGNTLTLEVTGVREPKGQMACALFWQNKGFPRKHRRALRRTWVDVEGDTVKCVFKRTGLGEYAASVFLDINNNGKLDTNVTGRSSEPWGVSKNVKSKRQGPELYKEAKFRYEGGEVTMPIELVYED